MRIGLRELIFLAVLLAVPVAAYVYVFRPHNAEMTESQAQIETMERLLEEVRALDEDRAEVERQLEIGAHNLQIINNQLPSEQAVHEVLKEVTTYAEAHDLNVVRFGVQKSLPAAHYREAPIKLEISGSFDGFYQFMTKVERLPRITRVHDLKLERFTSRTTNPDDDMPDGWMQGTLLLSIYYRPPAMATADLAAAR